MILPAVIRMVALRFSSVSFSLHAILTVTGSFDAVPFNGNTVNQDPHCNTNRKLTRQCIGCKESDGERTHSYHH